MRKKLSEIEKLENTVVSMKKMIHYSKLELLEKEELEIALDRLYKFCKTSKEENDILNSEAESNQRTIRQLSSNLSDIKRESSSNEREAELLTIIEDAKTIISKIKYPILIKESESVQKWIGKYMNLSKTKYYSYNRVA